MSKLAVRTCADFHAASSLPDAAAALAERGEQGQALAGATWIMRAALRAESPHKAYVARRRAAPGGAV